MQNLAHLASQQENSFEISDGTDQLRKEDYVFLFADAEDKALPTELFNAMMRLCEVPPAAAVLVLDQTVYGTCFDEGCLRKEEALGYVCHTKDSDMPAQNMRLAEHLAVKLAREDKVPIRIVRAQSSLAGEELEQMILSAIQVAFDGEDGEIYNLSAHPSVKDNAEISPLAPRMPATDTAKVEHL